MIDISKTKVVGFEPAIRGMRNPFNSWSKSDSAFYDPIEEAFVAIYGQADEKLKGLKAMDDAAMVAIGENDENLMKKLINGGPVHAKFRRMIVVYADIKAPLYWWKEFDTYKVGTVANSCSTMHKIQAKEFDISDFSCEHFDDLPTLYELKEFDGELLSNDVVWALSLTIKTLNRARELYLKTKDKKYWWQMIQLLPSSYNQKRTVMLNYEVLADIYASRHNHKLDEWHTFCDWAEELPYSWIFTSKEEGDA